MPTMDPANLDVIVLNWRTAAMSADCARLAAESLPGAALYVVDNGSGDGSADYLRQNVKNATVVANSENLGFGGGLNAGIRAGKRPFVLALNSDVRPVGLAYQLLLDHCASDDRLGAVTPRIFDAEGGAVSQAPPEPSPLRQLSSCLPGLWRFSIAAGNYRPEAGPPEPIAWLPSMCATMFRREALEGIGSFDTGYFLGWEEWDLTRRLRAGGWRIALHRGAEVIHDRHGSTPNEMKLWRDKHGRASLCHHLRKHHGPGWYALGRVATGITDLYLGARQRG
jgi:N-acetylglucosaminyl-diphospho-decaprenol L-rhamnosyltransferase